MLERIDKYFFIIRRIIVLYISTIIAKIKCSLWNIPCGKKLKTYGSILFYKEPGSKISIGDHCCFNSSDLLNFRGINHRCILQTGSSTAEIKIGNGCSFSGVSIVCDNQVILHDNVRVGANSSIADRDGHGGGVKPVEIKENVWLGMNVIVLKGVTIGENSIIGAGSIVTKDIPANVVAAGNPCKVIKEISK